MVESSLELAKSPQQIIIPRSALGRVIGRNGERIKSVIERSGAQCRVQQDVDPCFVEIASEDPMALQVAREMVLSFLESGLQSGTWDLEEACRAKAAATLAPHQARMLANLSSPLDPSRAALARQPVGREVVAEQMVDPYKFADAQWACAATPRAGSTTLARRQQRDDRPVDVEAPPGVCKTCLIKTHTRASSRSRRPDGVAGLPRGLQFAFRGCGASSPLRPSPRRSGDPYNSRTRSGPRRDGKSRFRRLLARDDAQ